LQYRWHTLEGCGSSTLPKEGFWFARVNGVVVQKPIAGGKNKKATSHTIRSKHDKTWDAAEMRNVS
jgi:hypothetical protein